jgi:putative membrane protein
MIVRTRFRLFTSIRYAWKNILFSSFAGTIAWVTNMIWKDGQVSIPVGVVAILGTALAIILGFRNTSAYERWWEARKIWGGLVNESRTFSRQALTIVSRASIPANLWRDCTKIIRAQLALVNALRLQLREQDDPAAWKSEVGKYLSEEDYEEIIGKSNKVTHIGMLMGYAIKELNAHELMDTFSYIQMDDTLTRIMELQGSAERIKTTPLPVPYDYYTMAFLSLFVLFFPFSFVGIFEEIAYSWMVIPVTVVVSWIFYQIYVIGKVMSKPFANWKTDVALTSICRVIEVDLLEIINETDIPEYEKPKGGAIM